MLTTITICIIALHMAVTFPAELTAGVKLWSLGSFGILALASLLSAFAQAIKRRDMTLFRNMLLMKAIGFMITFSYAFLEEEKTAMITAIRSQILTASMSIALFFVLKYIIACFRFYRSTALGYAALAGVPVFLLLARLLGRETHGSYLSILGILVFSLCMVLMPFATAAAFSDMRTVNFLDPKLTAVSGGELIYIIVLAGIAFLSGKVNHEYGIVLIFVGCLGGLIFFMYGRSTGSKLFFSATAVFLSLYVTMTSTKVAGRLSVILHLRDQWNRGHLSQEATQLYYFLLRIRGAGFYGYGNAMLSSNLYPTAENDYIFMTLIYNHGLLIGVLSFLLTIAVCRIIMRTQTGNRYDTVLVQSIGITLAAIYIISFFGNLGSLPLTGISAVFLAGAGRSMDAAGAIMLGIAAGVADKSFQSQPHKL